MPSFEWDLQSLWKLVWNVFQIAADALTFLRLCLCSPASVAAENLFLRKQLALYVERQKKPRRATDSIRFTLGQLCRFFDWRDALIIVKPDTLFVGIAKAFDCFGNGNLSLAAVHAYPTTFGN
jgi:hypothetical protein